MKTRLMSISIKSISFLLIGISILLVGCERMPQQTGVLPTAEGKQANAMIGSLGDSGVTGDGSLHTKRRPNHAHG